MNAIHPDLARVARWLPTIPTTERSIAVLRWLSRLAPPASARGVNRASRTIPGRDASRALEVHVYRPESARGRAPALLWMHGGGYVLGHPLQDGALAAHFARELGITVVAVRYALAPQSPYPAPVEDCYAALRWMHEEHAALDIDRDRIAIGGASAGAGLTAALALLARDRPGVKPAFQLLLYPMLDDRTALREGIDESLFRLWNQRNNRFGWRSYLGREPGHPDVSMYAAAGRCEDLRGVAPAWLGVGTLDLFLDENIAYAKRLEAQGVPCESVVVDGAFHAFDLVAPSAEVSRRFRGSQVEALRRALFS